MSSTRNPASTVPQGLSEPFPDRFDISGVTSEGAAWLASAGAYPRSTLALWEDRPTAPVVLPCGSAFDVVNTPVIFGRRILDRLWEEGPGSGPVAAFRGRMLLFAAPGTAQRLPSLLRWEEWGSGGASTRGSAIPPLLCHGTGDAVTVPALSLPSALAPTTPTTPTTRLESRWLVAPDTRHPWLPGAEILLWAAVRATREGSGRRPRRPGPPQFRGYPEAPGRATDIDFSSRRSEC
ncbi:bifunctional DNA primase/polymerase [Streptomyces sp. NPDC050704]|uniref:bifunctional DNA primase/polymerase n=1 Tax=Streptomyces sp. NPDC050704 TaxID=3157219 RepID=UPI003428D144